jgi:hypothetical protein
LSTEKAILTPGKDVTQFDEAMQSLDQYLTKFPGVAGWIKDVLIEFHLLQKKLNELKGWEVVDLNEIEAIEAKLGELRRRFDEIVKKRQGEPTLFRLKSSLSLHFNLVGIL